MRRRILATSIAGGVMAAGAWMAVPVGTVVLADGCNTTAPTPSSDATSIPVPSTTDPTVTGGEIYAEGSGTSGGGGITGDSGYLYANGGTDGGTIQGHENNTGVNGSVTVGSSPAVCVPNQN